MPFPTPYPFLLYGSRAIKVEDSICNLKKQNSVFQSQNELILFLKQRTFSLTKQQQQQILPWNKVVVLPPVAHF